MTLLDVLGDSPALLVGTCGMLGLLLGSFINVVSLRLPAMMAHDWRVEAREILELPAVAEPRQSLLRPPSSCTACGTLIRPWHNVPVFGWLWLRGKAACCGAPISVQYPVVELASGVLSAACAWQLGMGAPLLVALFLTWTLLTLAVIDARTTLLPDSITLPLVWTGLAAALFGYTVPLTDAVIGAMAGYLSLWSIFWAFKLVTGKDGMGYGDFKLFAALGAWMGWQQLPLIILLSSLVGAAVGIGLMFAKRAGRDLQLPFGPYLAAAGWIALLWGPALVAGYRHSMGL